MKRRALELSLMIYERHPTGCCLHIALDDGNLADTNIQFCSDYALKRGHFDCIELSDIMLVMTEGERTRLMRATHKALNARPRAPIARLEGPFQ